MNPRDTELRWEPRVPPDKIRRLYETDARGILDEELLGDVAYALYSRCSSIITVTEAICQRRLPCPRCSQSIALHDRRAEFIRCAGCAWKIRQDAFRRSYRNKRLGGYGAIDAFRSYVERFLSVRSPQDKMLLIDRLIHAMHNELANRIQRPAAVNLIEGNTQSVVELPGVGRGRSDWQRTREAQTARQARTRR